MTPLIMGLLAVPLAISAILLLIRFFKGPSNLDRLVCFESLTILIICLAGYLGMLYQTEWFFDSVLILSLIGFLSTVAVTLQMSRDKGEA